MSTATVLSAPLSAHRRGWSATAGALVALTKPRLAVLSVMTTLLAYAAARPDWTCGKLLPLVGGTAASAAGALALNQWRERDTDGRMTRTRGRPLPTHRVSPALALAWSLVLATVGVGVLARGVNVPAAAWSLATILLYAGVYTPLKRRSHWATELGAVSGALPPLIGWAAAEGRISALGGWLFAILFFWQLPHFFSIGWRCRHEYRAAGFPLLPAIDATGARTARAAFAHTVLLLAVSLAPWAQGFTGAVSGTIVAALGGGFLWLAWRFLRASGDRGPEARRLFLASLVYLPLVLGALVADRLHG